MIQADAGIPNPELRRVHTNRDAAGARIYIVAREAALSFLVQLPRRGERERVGGDNLAGTKMFANAHPFRTCHRAPRILSVCQVAAHPTPPSRQSTPAFDSDSPRA